MSDETPFIDIHNHLLPGVDDGSADIDMSLRLIEKGQEEGIGAWVLTPHVIEAFTERIDERHRAAFADLQSAIDARNIGVELYLGSEIMFQEDVTNIRSRWSSTINNNGKYFLMEFPMAFFPVHAEEILFQFQLKKMVPIVAHVERYASLAQQPGTIAGMVDRGILLQVNARSIMRLSPPSLRMATEELIMSGAVHFVASDAHNPDRRPPELREAYERVAHIAGEDTAIRLFIENPRKAILGERIETIVPDLPYHPGFVSRFIDKLFGRKNSDG
jgi:protein-tyrosine phosphatase